MKKNTECVKGVIKKTRQLETFFYFLFSLLVLILPTIRTDLYRRKTVLVFETACDNHGYVF